MLGKLKPKCGRHKVQSEDFEHWLLVAFIHTSLVAQMVLKLLVNKDLVLTLGCGEGKCSVDCKAPLQGDWDS